jgi:1-deoxy-D-xylulose-5-phosphate reductoisomerase
VAVAAFLECRIRYTDIAVVVARTLEGLPAQPLTGGGIEELLDVDRRAREVAEQNLIPPVG